MTALALKRVRWFCVLWSIAASCFVALAVEPVPALLIPVYASALLIVPGNARGQRVLAGVAFTVLLFWLIAGLVSVGAYYLPSVFAAVTVASPPGQTDTTET